MHLQKEKLIKDSLAIRKEDFDTGEDISNLFQLGYLNTSRVIPCLLQFLSSKQVKPKITNLSLYAILASP